MQAYNQKMYLSDSSPLLTSLNKENLQFIVDKCAYLDLFELKAEIDEDADIRFQLWPELIFVTCSGRQRAAALESKELLALIPSLLSAKDRKGLSVDSYNPTMACRLFDAQHSLLIEFSIESGSVVAAKGLVGFRQFSVEPLDTDLGKEFTLLFGKSFANKESPQNK